MRCGRVYVDRRGACPEVNCSFILPKRPDSAERSNMIFSGTAATYGRGRAVVVATGMQTQMGRIAGTLTDAPTETTPLQKELKRVR